MGGPRPRLTATTEQAQLIGQERSLFGRPVDLVQVARQRRARIGQTDAQFAETQKGREDVAVVVGQPLDDASGIDHRRDAATDVTLPRQIEIRWPASQLTMTIRANQWQVNAAATNPSLWTMPDYPGWAPVDLGNPNFRMPRTAQRY